MRDYLTVGQISRLFNLSKQTLQYYDKEQIFCPKYRHPENNYRLYRFDQIYSLALICYLRRLGFSIAQIKNYQGLHDSSAAIRELQNQSQQLQQQCQQVLSMDRVLQRKLHFVERQLKTLELGQTEIRTYPQRKYIPLGDEDRLYNNEVFYFYPTIAFVRQDIHGKHISFGAYLEPDDSIPVRFMDDIGTLPSQRYLCACFQGHYDDAVAYADHLRQTHPELELSPDSVHFNIIDQFIETDAQAYITDIQIPILHG